LERQHVIGARRLLLGMYEHAGRLTYVGNVGTGFTHRMLTDLARQLRPPHRSTLQYPVSTPATPIGSSPVSSARSATAR
jgi:ATP-dependent DNA ligase